MYRAFARSLVVETGRAQQRAISFPLISSRRDNGGQGTASHAGAQSRARGKANPRFIVTLL